MDSHKACSIIEGFSGEEHTEQEHIEVLQFLIDSGEAWSLQGFYGRMAKSAIDQGICHA